MSDIIIKLREIFLWRLNVAKCVCRSSMTGHCTLHSKLNAARRPYPLSEHSDAFFIWGSKTCFADVSIDYLSSKNANSKLSILFPLGRTRIFCLILKNKSRAIAMNKKINHTTFGKNVNLVTLPIINTSCYFWHSYCIALSSTFMFYTKCFIDYNPS